MSRCACLHKIKFFRYSHSNLNLDVQAKCNWRNKNNLLQKLKRCKFLSQQTQPVFCEMLVFSCHIMQRLARRFEDNISESSAIYTTSEKGLERGIECYLCNRSLTWFAISCGKELGPSYLYKKQDEIWSTDCTGYLTVSLMCLKIVLVLHPIFGKNTRHRKTIFAIGLK